MCCNIYIYIYIFGRDRARDRAPTTQQPPYPAAAARTNATTSSTQTSFWANSSQTSFWTSSAHTSFLRQLPKNCFRMLHNGLRQIESIDEIPKLIGNTRFSMKWSSFQELQELLGNARVQRKCSQLLYRAALQYFWQLCLFVRLATPCFMHTPKQFLSH